MKKRLVAVLDELLDPIRTRRKQYEKDLVYVRQILNEGNERAREAASRKLREAKQAMKLLY